MQISKISNSNISPVYRKFNSNEQETSDYNTTNNNTIIDLSNYSQNIYMVNFRGANKSSERPEFDAEMVTITIEDRAHCENKNIKFRHPESNIVTGPNFHYYLSNQYSFLNEYYGLEAVILLSEGFRCSAADIAKNTQGKGVDFLHFNLAGVLDFSNSEYFEYGENEKLIVKDEFVNKLKKYFELLNTKNVYMGCEQGIDRTNIGILLNYCFNNPDRVISAELAHTSFIRGDVDYMISRLKMIYDALTDEQKEKLNLPEPVFTNPLEKFPDYRANNPYKFQKWIGHINADTKEPCTDYQILTGEDVGKVQPVPFLMINYC